MTWYEYFSACVRNIKFLYTDVAEHSYAVVLKSFVESVSFFFSFGFERVELSYEPYRATAWPCSASSHHSVTFENGPAFISLANTELELQGGALRLELVLSGFFLSAYSSVDPALEIPASYIRRRHGAKEIHF